MEKKRFPVSLHGILFLILVAVSLVIRINNLDYPPLQLADPAKDYLVSHHIVADKEFISAGPGTSILIIRNSPLYSYLLALFLVIKDDFFFLALVNIFLQIFTLFIIYKLAQKLFGSTPALIAAILFSFSQHLTHQSYFLFQPYVMQPFINASYLLLLLAYLKKNYLLVLAAICTFLFAGALHIAAFLAAPLFLVLTIFVLKKQGVGARRYLLAFAVFLGFFLLFYLSVFIFIYRHGLDAPPHLGISNLFVQSFSLFFKNLLHTGSTFLNMFFQSFQYFGKNNIPFLTMIVTLLTAVAYFLSKKTFRKQYAIILLLGIIQLIITVSLMNNIPLERFHFVPILGLFIILIAGIVHFVFSGSVRMKIGKVLMVILLVNLFSHQFYDVKTRSHFTNLYRITSVVDVIEREIFIIQKRDDFARLDFFQLRAYATNRDTFKPYLSATFWMFLEKDLKTKFTVNTGSRSGFVSTNDNTYVFVICLFTPYPNVKESKCVDAFLNDRQHGAKPRTHSLVKKIYSEPPFIIYVFKRTNAS